MSKKKQHGKQFKLDAVQYRRNILILPRLNVQRTLVSTPALSPAGKHSSGIIPATFSPEVPATIPLTSRKKLPVSNGNSVMPKMHLTC